ncbi:MAG: glutathione peroxidase [Bacteroidales bacterium]|nr:glutathione peroxidase [Bacteroidales bacterium]MCF8391202.1 glutathione peroxidase [Bacteroidales bacterium]
MSFYDFEIAKPNGTTLRLNEFKGKIVLVVNTATMCGLAPQFEGLEALHQKYKAKGLVVLGFPSNQFRNQEPQSNESMEEVCKINHGVSFQLTEKIDVNGENTHPVFRYLKDELPGTFTKKIKWNFTKFLIDANGKPFKRYAPTVIPSKIEKDILKLISKNE